MRSLGIRAGTMYPSVGGPKITQVVVSRENSALMQNRPRIATVNLRIIILLEVAKKDLWMMPPKTKSQDRVTYDDDTPNEAMHSLFLDNWIGTARSVI